MFGTNLGAFEMVALSSDDNATKKAIETIEENDIPAPHMSELDRYQLTADVLQGKRGTYTQSDVVLPQSGVRPSRKTPKNYPEITRNNGPLRPGVVRAIESFAEVQQNLPNAFLG